MQDTSRGITQAIARELYGIFFTGMNLVKTSPGPQTCSDCGTTAEEIPLRDYVTVYFCPQCQAERGVWIDEDALGGLIERCAGEDSKPRGKGFWATVLRFMGRGRHRMAD